VAVAVLLFWKVPAVDVAVAAVHVAPAVHDDRFVVARVAME